MRYVGRFFLRLIRDVDGLIDAATSRVFRRQYRVVGACRQRGVCCRSIGISMHPSSAKSRVVLQLVRWWYTFVYHFIYKGVDQHVMIFTCRYLVDNRCSIHKRRPFLCRNYPIVSYFKQPVFLPGCGFSCDKSR